MALESTDGAVICKAVYNSEKKHSVKYDIIASTTEEEDDQIGAFYFPRKHGKIPGKIVILVQPKK